MTAPPGDPVAALEALFAGPGGQAYLGEAVSIATHMLQAAARATAASGPDPLVAPDPLIAAALLHDVGHLLGAADVDHPRWGADWLARWLPPAVTEPVRLHVEAKRYLCAAEPGYARTLSAESARTLALQGGPMTPAEAAAFAADPHFTAAVTVRRWDEAGKLTGVAVPPVAAYRTLLASLRTDR